MPIYAYRCESCGFAKDVLQKISDAPLTQCPSCGADAYRKQVTAAGFQLKGSGWYVTDFRGGNSNGNNSGTSAAATGAKDAKSGDAASSSEGGKSERASPASPAAAATTSAAPAASGTSGST
ncbi:FmdB family zinc ribbon protein [Paraburkholderia tropica]|uniref:FmdB family zinc ribbon protein n=1 Tax=Paraburkholderia tropica TaxID=92647 RepID=UPI0007ED606C|nr:zinc ribbon domain-containing protein [Paraburkholderia tropica]MBB2982888.1 putative FmdB family regulatory protein [Paraburkholderia tropica]OBR52565.1 FmdB family transcriptional regulator [Paraburkholderia tropica]